MDLSLLQEMISIPSVFPNEGTLGAFLYGHLQSLGFVVEKQTVGEDRFNVLAEKGVGNSALMFYGHLDTVPVYGDWDSDPYTLTARGDKLIGLGANDMKGGIFTILEAVRDLSIPDGKKIKIALCVDEENDSVGAYALSSHPFLNDVQCIISAEIGNEEHQEEGVKSMYLGRRGRVGISIAVPGISAHGAHPETGVNAILEAYKVISELEKMPLPQHPELGHGTQFVQEMSARSGSLSVPDRCEIYISRLLVPPETPENALAEIRQFVENLYAQKMLVPRNGQKATVNLAARATPYYHPYITDEHTPQVRKLIQFLEQRHFKKIIIDYGLSVADENIFGGINQIPTITLGPEGGNEHTANEWVSKRSLEQMVTIYQDIIQHLEV